MLIFKNCIMDLICNFQFANYETMYKFITSNHENLSDRIKGIDIIARYIFCIDAVNRDEYHEYLDDIFSEEEFTLPMTSTKFNIKNIKN